MCCTGQPTEYQNITPQWMQDFQKQIIQNYIMPNLGQTATPYEGPLTYPVPQPAYNAMDLMNRMMGYGGYTPADPLTYSSWNISGPTPTDTGTTDTGRKSKPRDGGDGIYKPGPWDDPYAPYYRRIKK